MRCLGSGAHDVQGEEELALFNPRERWLRGDLFVVFCFTKGTYREDRAASPDTCTANGQKMTVTVSAREIATRHKGKKYFTTRVFRHYWSERLWNICPQRYPKLDVSSPTNLSYEGGSTLSWGIKRDDLQRSLLIWSIQWSKQLNLRWPSQFRVRTVGWNNSQPQLVYSSMNYWILYSMYRFCVTVK